MSFLNSLAIWQWAFLALVPPAILLLYFLKLKRHPLEVPSTYLWSRTIEDLHVNTIWQRLRQNLLLFLQLLLIALIILSLIRPGWESTATIDRRSIFVVDTSASMSATDVNTTRLDEAKKRIAQMIGEMDSGDVAMIISVADDANVEQPFTDSKNLLLKKLREIKPTNHRTDIEQALRYAAGLANPGRTATDATDVQVAQAMPATLYIFSDGRFPKFKNFFLGNLTPVYYPMGSDSADNLAIGSFSVERNPEKPDRIQAFARIDNYGPEDVDCEVSLFVDGELRDAEEINVPTDGRASLQFEMDDLEQGELKLVVDRKDDLASDNQGYVAANLPRRAKVLLVTDYNDALSTALSTISVEKYAEVSRLSAKELKNNAEIAKQFEGQTQAGAFDLIIFDRFSPEVMPQANTVFFNALPPVEGWALEETQPRAIVIDHNRSHPLIQLIDMGNVNILECRTVKTPAGGASLVDADIGTIMGIAPRQGYEDVVIGFEMYSPAENGIEINTDWQIRRSFPVFVMNMIKYLGGARGSMASLNVKPGEAAIIRSRLVVDKIRVKSPSGEETVVDREGENSFVYTFTDKLGVYEVREGDDDDVSQRFTVNLFDTRESNILPLSEIELGEGEGVQGQTGIERSRFELWKWILLLGFGVLIFEWYIYNRRVYL